MFGGSRRRRPPTTPLNSATANPNATTAAASAFMSAASQNPNKTLSSAAAAAALRARPHTPTNVAQVQTKRTVRRSASVSSSGSAPVGARLANGRSRLERRDSTTSMTERTFRSPSPHRSSTPAATEQRPPVPQIPDSHKSSTANSKAIGVGMQNFRTASQKMADEPPSWHVQPTGDVSNVRTSDSIMRTTKSPPDLANPITPQTSRPESRSSVNFSYPTSFRPQSPPASPTSLSMSHTKVSSPHPPTSVTNAGRGTSSNSHAQSNQQLVYDPNSRRMVPKSQVNEPMEHPIQKVADKPSKSRKDCGLRREGSQLAKGTVARAKGTMVGENRSLRELPKRDQPVIEAMPTTKEMLLETEFEPESVVATENANLITSSQLSVVGESKSQDSSPSKPETLSKQESDSQPSHFAFNHTAVAQGESKANVEVPKMGNRPKPSQTILDALDAIPMRQTLFEGRHPHPGYNLDPHETAQDPRPRNMAPKRTELLEASSEQKAAVAENKPVTVLASESSALRRSNSNSPARQARFAPSPSENLAVRHVPLPRSASPIKSAMKHSSPIQRETSPSDNISDPSGSGAVSPDQKEEPAVLRKKSVRVSFEDQSTVIVGDPTPAMEADSIASQSPQGHRRTWFSNIGRSKKKEVTLDDDEIMKPRPALPSFGSIRDKKKRGLEERPLVRPLEPAESPAISTSPELRPQSSSTLNDSDVIEEPTLGQSSDHAIGALLVQDQTSRNAANISRFREPLPPVVTSVEEYGYSSDSFQGSDSEEQCDTTTEAGISTMNSSVLSAQVAPPDPHDQNQGPAAASDIPQSKQEQTPYPEATQQQEIPQISVIQPSPMPSESAIWANESSTAHYFDVPGSFPGGDSHLSCDDWAKATKNGVVESDLPSSTSVPEPNTALAESAQVEALPRTTSDTTASVTKLNQAITDDATEDESDESIYSDAYEDIPDFDASGFMSLDAIVEGPTVEEPKPSSSQISESLPTPAITSKHAEDRPLSQDRLSPPQDTSDWEQAKAFWRSLTAEKRRQLELEAAEEAGADGDREEVSQPTRRSSTRRKTPESTQPVIQMPPTQNKVSRLEPRMRTSRTEEQTTKSTSTPPRIGMRKSLRPNGGTQSVSKPSTRETVATTKPAPTPVTKHEATKLRPRSAALSDSRSQLSTQVKPTLQRRGSDASDSSFKRSRRQPGGAIAFRKTMRQTSPIQHHHDPIRGSGRFSLRSLSPVGSTVRRESDTSFTTPSPRSIKRTLRSNGDSGHEAKRSSIHFPLFARSTKSPPRGSKWTSKLKDSSDEDEQISATFQSRIHDSSDEEESRSRPSKGEGSIGKAVLPSSATAPSLSRPAPVPEVEEDSPELPDSDDDFMPSPLRTPQSRTINSDLASHLGTGRPRPRAIGTSTLGRSRSGRGGLSPSFTSPALSSQDRRGSLLGILRRNKRADQTGKIQRSEPIDSAARRDTRLERGSGQLKDLRGEQHSSPKLQKRSSISRSDNGGLRRPTSAGDLLGRSTANAIELPNLGNRRSLSLGLNPNNESYDIEDVSAENPIFLKKKKFGALRRIFKLDE